MTASSQRSKSRRTVTSQQNGLRNFSLAAQLSGLKPSTPKVKVSSTPTITASKVTENVDRSKTTQPVQTTSHTNVSNKNTTTSRTSSASSLNKQQSAENNNDSENENAIHEEIIDNKNGTSFGLQLQDNLNLSHQMSTLNPNHLSFTSVKDGNTQDDMEKDVINDQFPNIILTGKSARKQDSIHVRKHATDCVFRGVKFINTRRMMQEIMGKVSKHYMISSDTRVEWELAYEKDLKYAINNKRNSVSQDIKRTLKSKYSCIHMFVSLRL